ncbi:molecular chaperone [candidate division CSSED10-310 bacterium]|uniref:Molecular chaperone n=1 Tax=candidate division CSSED10-310 bacterium TaxID=2855610 RepID=A0ABV6YRA7_UNCC1
MKIRHLDWNECIAFLGRAFYFPNKELVVSLQGQKEFLQKTGHLELWQWLKRFPEVKDLLSVLEKEHDRLFSLQRATPCVSIYANTYQADISMSELQILLTNEYLKYDYDVAAGVGLRPDHIAVILDFAADLYSLDATAFARFVENQINTWIQAFCHKVQQATKSPFYLTCADLVLQCSADNSRVN